MADHERFSPDGLPPPSGYAHAVRAGGIVFLSGQVALDADRNLVGRDDMEAQATQAFSNLTALLDEVGLEWPDVAKLTIYLTDMSQIEAVRRVRATVYEAGGTEAPATTTVGVTALAIEGAMLEVEAIAIARA